MKVFDWIVLTISSLWLLMNLGLVLWALGSKAVRSVEIKPAFLIPIAGLLFVAYRIWG
jgi:hypothetical protein